MDVNFAEIVRLVNVFEANRWNASRRCDRRSRCGFRSARRIVHEFARSPGRIRPGPDEGGSSAVLVAGARRFLFPLLVQLLQEIVESHLLIRRENRPDIGAPLPADLLARSIERGVESLPF